MSAAESRNWNEKLTQLPRPGRGPRKPQVEDSSKSGVGGRAVAAGEGVLIRDQQPGSDPAPEPELEPDRPVVEASSPVVDVRGTPSRRGQGAGKRVRHPDSSRRFSVWVPVEVKHQLQQACRMLQADPDCEDPTVTGVVIAAFNGYYARLGELFPQPTAAALPMPAKVRRRRRSGEATLVQLTLYMSPAQEAVLDAAVETSAASSRSNLVTKLLEEYLHDVVGSRPSRHG